MKVALERGDVLEIALLEGNSVVGTISLQLRGNTGGLSASTSGRAAASASSASQSSAGETSGKKRGRKGKRNLSPEARERMRQAQLRRWAKTRKGSK